MRLDFLPARACLFLRIPGGMDLDPCIVRICLFGEERLSQAVLIVGDQMGSGPENMRRGPVIALQPDHGGAGKILLEAQDVVHLRAAPAIDRLIVVADTTDIDLVFAHAVAACAASLRGGGRNVARHPVGCSGLSMG